MADWPELDELKQVLDVTGTEWDGDTDNTRFTRLLASAIDLTKAYVGGTPALYDDIYTEPTDRHAQAALRIGELLAVRPGQTATLINVVIHEDPTLRRLLFGQRHRFGVA